jgi:3-mercaptopyruvate sulfurtransferase SseA
MFPTATSVLGAACLIASFGVATSAAEAQNRSDVERGKTLYRSLCQRCHGPDGDAISYPGVVPVVGVERRLDEAEIVRVAAGTLGRSFDERQGRALHAFLETLGGAKGFAEAGWLFSPYLAERRLPKVHDYRIVDVRSRAEYDAGHLPNALHWSPPVEAAPCRLSEEAASVLGDLGITPEMFVVFYDDVGGPRAACAWWALASLGHDRAAVLDGGWRRWVDEGRPVQTDEMPLPRGSYSSREDAPREEPCDLGESGAATLRLDWDDLLGEDGFRTAEEIEDVLGVAGFQGPGVYSTPGDSADAAGVAFVLKLLGHDPVAVDHEAGGICVRSSQITRTQALRGRPLPASHDDEHTR